MSRPASPQSAHATLIGFAAVLLWSTLATLTVATGSVPPFELTGLTFAVGGALGLAVALLRGRGRFLRPPLPALALGVAGLFGDYVLYFGALRLAPPAQAALIVALWPLIMILLAAHVLGERLKPNHVLGMGLGLAAMLVLATCRSASLVPDVRCASGYAMALGAAVVWAGYSVLSRRQADVPGETLTSACLVAAALAGACHLVFEDSVAPTGFLQVLAIGAVGLGPAGGAFFLWDFGVKRGNVRVLAILAYAIPVLSMVLLVSTGNAPPSAALAAACLLIALAGLCATHGSGRPGPVRPGQREHAGEAPGAIVHRRAGTPSRIACRFRSIAWRPGNGLRGKRRAGR